MTGLWGQRCGEAQWGLSLEACEEAGSSQEWWLWWAEVSCAFYLGYKALPTMAVGQCGSLQVGRVVLRRDSAGRPGFQPCPCSFLSPAFAVKG